MIIPHQWWPASQREGEGKVSLADFNSFLLREEGLMWQGYRYSFFIQSGRLLLWRANSAAGLQTGQWSRKLIQGWKGLNPCDPCDTTNLLEDMHKPQKNLP